MAQPAFYAHAPADVRLHETHISWVFLAGDRAFKLRKAVVFPFLDYGTPERRRHMCEEEVRLGRRLAPDLYLGVRAVVPREDGFALAEAGHEDACEHVVEMRRFDEARTLAARLERGEVERTRRARSRAGSPRSTPAQTRRRPAASARQQVAATVSENFTTLLAFADEIGDPRLAAAHRFAVAFLHGRHDELAARGGAGCVRDCHGDLRAEHVILEGDGVEIFDPVEFDPALRLIDVAADLAFLVMELVEAGRADLARALVDEYRAAGGDDGGRCPAGLLRRLSRLGAGQGRVPAGSRAAAGRPTLERARPRALAGGARGAALMARAAAARARRLRRVCHRQDLPGTRARAVLGPRAPELRRRPQGAGRSRAGAASACDGILRGGEPADLRRAGRASGGGGSGGGAVVDATFRRRSDRAALSRTLTRTPPPRRCSSSAAHPPP